MPNTTNWNIYYPDGSTKPEMNTVIAGTASSVETALDNVVADRQLHSFVVANATALNALTGMTAGDTAFQQDIGALYVYTGADWRPYSTTDTGWITVPYDAGYKASAVSGADALMYRVKNGVLYFVGGGTNTAETLVPGSTYLMATGGIPLEYRPLTSVYASANGSGSRGGSLVISTTGNIQFQARSSNPSNTAWLGGSLSYPIG